jgi:thioredoxin 1
MVKEITSLKGIIPNKRCLIDCSASWCGPCKRIAPLYEELSTKYRDMDIDFLKADIDTASDLADFYSVTVLPTFLYIDSEEEVSRVESSSIEEVLKELQKLKWL